MVTRCRVMHWRSWLQPGLRVRMKLKGLLLKCTSGATIHICCGWSRMLCKCDHRDKIAWIFWNKSFGKTSSRFCWCTGVSAVPILYILWNADLQFRAVNVQGAISGNHNSLYRSAARSEYCFAGSLSKVGTAGSLVKFSPLLIDVCWLVMLLTSNWWSFFLWTARYRLSRTKQQSHTFAVFVCRQDRSINDITDGYSWWLFVCKVRESYYAVMLDLLAL